MGVVMHDSTEILVTSTLNLFNRPTGFDQIYYMYKNDFKQHNFIAIHNRLPTYCNVHA